MRLRNVEGHGTPQAWVPLRHRQNDAQGNPALLRIVKSPTEWVMSDGRRGEGMCEYHDRIVDGRRWVSMTETALIWRSLGATAGAVSADRAAAATGAADCRWLLQSHLPHRRCGRATLSPAATAARSIALARARCRTGVSDSGRAGPTNVPVPQVECLARMSDVIGAPFYVMRWVEGTVIDTPAAASVHCRTSSCASVPRTHWSTDSPRCTRWM